MAIILAGNQSVDKTTRNALRILSAAGLDHIGVVKGQAKPIVRPALASPEIHGESGMDLHEGEVPESPLQPQSGKAVLAMFERIQQFYADSREPVHLVATGALTNVALLLSLYPEVGPMLEQIVVMGGAIGSGNINPVAEFNILCDPEAAKIVFESGIKVVLVPLEVTHTALMTQAVLDRICARETPFLALIRQLLLFFSETYKSVFNFDAPPLHDPCAIFYVLQPEAFQIDFMRVDVETASPITAGQTVCDIYHMSSLPKNVYIALKMDVGAFWECQIAALHAADAASALNTSG